MMFAAGFGTRMGTLTNNKPKALIDVAGTPLINHALNQVLAYGPERIVVNTHYCADQIEHHLRHDDVMLSHESSQILETGGGLKAALPLLKSSPVFTMNTDAVWQGRNALKVLSKVWDPEKMDALLLCLPLENAFGHTGIGDFCIAPDGKAERGPGAVYSGVQIIKTDILKSIDDTVFSLNIVWDEMLLGERLYATCYSGTWCDVGTPQGILLAEKMLRSSDA